MFDSYCIPSVPFIEKTRVCYSCKKDLPISEFRAKFGLAVAGLGVAKGVWKINCLECDRLRRKVAAAKRYLKKKNKSI